MDCLIDGERMEGDLAGTFVMFDLLEWEGVSIRTQEYRYRIARLEIELRMAGLVREGGATIQRAGGSGLLVLTPEVYDKRPVVEEIKASGGEGLIIRHLEGASLEGNTSLERKIKFLASLDAIVLGFNQGKAGGSARLALKRPDGYIEIGSVRSGLTQTTISQLNNTLNSGKWPVVEVSFLPARTVGISLVEPTYLRIRTDKYPVDCTTDQIVEILGDDRLPLIAAAAIAA